MKKQIFLLTVLAALVRLPAINVVLNGDEAPNFSWDAFIPWKALLFSYSTSGQHTLFIALARLSMGLFGESEVAFRLPVLVAGIFAVPLLYKVVVLLFDSREVATTASLLLVFSYYAVFYSQNGRAYSLTVFLALALVYAVIKLREGKSSWLWGGGLVVLGLSMILALPSNACFLAAVTVFFVIASWDEQKGLGGYVERSFLKTSIYFLFMLGLAISYLIAIYPDLQRALKFSQAFEESDKGTLGFAPIWIPNTLGFLVEPWGLWLYLFFAYGLWRMKTQRMLYPFLGLFLAPVALNFASGIFGPARIYIYWTPFVLMVTAIGLVNLAHMIGVRLCRQTGIGLGVLFSLIMLTQSALKLRDYYRNQFDLTGTKIADARQVLPYVKSLIGSRQLIVISHGDGVLSHYIGQVIFENNFKVLSDGELENIVFIAHNKIHLRDVRWVGSINSLPEEFFEVVHDIGNLRIYRYSGKISKLIPPHADPDFERVFAGVKTPPLFITFNTQSPRVLGNQSLAIQASLGKIKTAEDCIDIDFPNILPAASESDGQYVLLTYIKKFNQNSSILLKETGGRTKKHIFFNYANNLFAMAGIQPIWRKQPPFDFILNQVGAGVPRPESYWEMVFFLSEGKGDLSIPFRICNDFSVFDGVQTFLLAK